MGYRNYLYRVDKKKFNKIRKLSYDELLKLYGEVDDRYIGKYKLLESCDGKEVLTIGKYFNEDISQYLKKAFRDDSVQKYFNEETEFLIAKPELLTKLLEIYADSTSKYYKKLLEDESVDEITGKTHLDRLKRELEHKLVWLPYLKEIPKSEYMIDDTWLVEYECFNFKYLIKTFNFKKYYLLWLGY